MSNGRDDTSSLNILVVVVGLNNRLVSAGEKTTLLATARSVVVVGAGSLVLLLAVVDPLEDVEKERQEHKTGTSNGASEDSGVETSSKAKIGSGSAVGDRVSVTKWCVDAAGTATCASAVENGNGNESAHDEKVTKDAQDGEEGTATEAASHESSEEGVDDSTSSQSFNSLCLCVDTLEVTLDWFMGKLRFMRTYEVVNGELGKEVRPDTDDDTCGAEGEEVEEGGDALKASANNLAHYDGC